MSHLEDIAIRLQVYLEGLKSSTSAEFNRTLPLLLEIVEEEFGAQDLSSFSRSQLERIIKDIRSAQLGTTADAVDELMDGLQDLSKYVYDFERSAILAGSSVTALGKVSKFASRWKDTLNHPLSATGELLEPWMDGLSTNQIVSTENLIRRAHSEGWSTQKMLQALRGTRANRYADGIMQRIGRGNETIIRTAIQQVSSVARMKVWEENDDVVKGYRWVSTLDKKTSSVCRGLDGKEFKVGEGPLPPIHPNCRSTTVPVLDAAFKILERGATRSSATGRVPAGQTYYEWLSNQPLAFQESVIGAKRARLLNDGGLSVEEFVRLQLNRIFEPLTLDEMRRLKPLAFERAGI